MKEQSSFEFKNKITPTSHEVEVKTNLPVETVNELGAVTARCIDTIRKGSERVGTMLSNSTNAIGKPIGAWLEGKANEISANSQLIVANITYRKEINAIKHLQYVAEELNLKVENGEEIPEKIEESDNLLLIQDGASRTSNEQLLKMWAKLYAEEACIPGVVSKKTIKIMETMDSNVVKIIENTILPFCDDIGFFWGETQSITNLLLADDYGIICSSSISQYSKQVESILTVAINDDYKLFLLPGYQYSASIEGIMYKLTQPGLEIYQNLKIKKSKQNLDTIFKNIEMAAKTWSLADMHKEKIKYKSNIETKYKYIICDKNNNVVSPENSPFKNCYEFTQYINNNIEEITNEQN